MCMHVWFNLCMANKHLLTETLNSWWYSHLCLWLLLHADFFYFLFVHSQCSKTCGRGLKKRSVFCRSTDPGAKAVVVPDSMCRQHHRPKAQETCVLRRCPKNERLQWIPTPWGEVGTKRHEAQGAVASEVKCVVERSTLKHLKYVKRNSFWWCTWCLWVHVTWWYVWLIPNVEDMTNKLAWK